MSHSKRAVRRERNGGIHVDLGSEPEHALARASSRIGKLGAAIVGHLP